MRPNLIDIKKSEDAIESMRQELKDMHAQIKDFENEISYLKGVQSGNSVLTARVGLWLALISTACALMYFLFKKQFDIFLTYLFNLFG